MPPSSTRSPSRPVVGFLDFGRPDLSHPRLAARLEELRKIGSIEVPVEAPLDHHPTAVLLAFLEQLRGAELSRCLFASVDEDSPPARVLDELAKLQARGAALISISYGRHASQREEGWGELEDGVARICANSELIVVAAAGQPTDLLPHGFDLHIPASVPEVIAVDGEDRWWGDPPGSGEDAVLLASREAPLGGPPGSSFAAPRIAAQVCRILNALPREFWRRAVVRRILRAACVPPPRGVPAWGRPDPERLEEILRSDLSAWASS